jgi:four helix bundle protein
MSTKAKSASKVVAFDVSRLPGRLLEAPAWKASAQLSELVHQLARKLPPEQLGVMTSELCTTALDLNRAITFAMTCETGGEFQSWTAEARGKLARLESTLYLCRDLEYGSAEELDALQLKIDEVSEEVAGLKHRGKRAGPNRNRL